VVSETLKSPSAAAAVNAMTVDVEDYFQVSAFEPYIDRGAWEGLPCRVERNTDRILGLFAERGVKATFFTLGWVAERYPGLIGRIVEAGHELACHGRSHVRVTEQTPEEFRDDVRYAKELLEDLSGRAVLGYRAASYSIGANNLWAFPVLESVGFKYSSSIYPVKHDLYGMPEAPRFAFRPTGDSGLLELPVTTVRLGERNYPCGGGGYFRLLPYRVSRWAMARVNRVDGQPCIFYFHPWEIDPGQPRQPGINLKTRFRHYLNLSRMEARLGRLLDDFRWGTMEQVFLSAASPPPARASAS
jgi:polysaccharide deacetylase family protein (PEP-CTERM system associated)